MIRRWIPRGRWRWVAGAIALVVALNVAALIESALRPEPSGRSGSAYATQPRGAAAWAELLTRSGHAVSYLRKHPGDARLDPRTTLVVLEASDLDGGDRAALGDFVAAGGRLVAAGRDPADWIGAELSRPPRWTFSGRRVASPVAPVPETAGVRSVATSGAGGFDDPGDALPVLGSDPALLVVALVGKGRALLLADSGPLQNRLLGRADNAALALALAGPKDRKVVFVESVHGFGEATGIAALPSRWRFALIGLVLAGLLWLLACARRFGPAEDLGPPPAPARREHVEALALALRRARDPRAALEPVRRQARAQIVRRSGLAPGAPDDEVRAAALRLGLDDDEAAALVADRDDDAALAAGRALAKGRR
jgi:hypothetical protein